ncbi:MAG: ABC transporter ATP-binding protein, partial [Clostridiales bacterium]
LDPQRKISAFSKGMKKQLSVLLAICANVPYLYCDETLDGLDPVMRRAIKSLFAGEVATRGLTPIIASHNLRELEDVCDHVGLLHQGGLLLSRELDNMKLNLHKIQAVFPYQVYPQAFSNLNVLSLRQSGNMYTLIVRGEEELISHTIAAKKPIYMEILPLSLEEAFICEMEAVGYEFQNLFL